VVNEPSDSVNEGAELAFFSHKNSFKVPQSFLLSFYIIELCFNQSHVFIKPFLNQLMSQSAVQKPILKPQTAREHGQDAKQGQIIIITVVVKGATGQHLRGKCQLTFHSRPFRVSLPILLSLES
jgi:hypothetical protein